jgi:hypothetical protein
MPSAPTVDAGYASWLKATQRTVGATIAGAQAAWGDGAVDSAVMSPLAFKTDAQAEATYQAQFLAGPLARDKIVVSGLRHDLLGRLVTIFGDRLGYEEGADVFVLGVAETEGIRTTTLTVLKRL